MSDINYTRPPKINNYPAQKRFVNSKARFCVVEASTKAGKTVGCIVWLFEQALQGKPGSNYWWVAPVSSVSEIALSRMRRYIQPQSLIKVNETKSFIHILPLDVKIWFKSADKPDSLYGEDVYAAVLDEATRMKESAYTAIYTTLTATGGKCRIIGNTKGTGNWVYKKCRETEEGKLPDWEYIKITADEAVAAGTYTKEILEAARKELSTGDFLELYYCIPNERAADKFAYAFDEKRHVGKCEFNPNLPVYLSFDFNRNPICCSVIQHEIGKYIHVIELIKLENSDIYRLCAVIKNKYPNSQFIVCGDATGRNSSALVPDNLNYFIAIKTALRLGDGSMQQLPNNPPLQDSQMLVNAILEHNNVVIDRDKAQALIFDMKFVRMDASGKIDKSDRNDPTKQADAIDTFRYFLQRYYWSQLKRIGMTQAGLKQ